MSDPRQTADQAVPLDPKPPKPGRRHQILSMGGRLAWTYADQGLSSIQTAALSIVLARAVDPAQFGAFSIAFTVYALAVAISDAIGGSILVIRFSASEGSVRRAATQAATGTSVVVGAIAALGLLVGAITETGDIRKALFVTCVVFPGLMLQDAWRTVFITRGTPKSAFINDALWLVLQTLGIVILEALGDHKVWAYLVVWGAAATIAAGYGCRQSGDRPAPSKSPQFLRSNKGVAVPALASALTAIGASQLSFLLIAAYGGLGSIGSLRGAQTLLGPLNIIGFATTAFAVPELVRRRPSRRHLLLAAGGVSALIVGTDVVWGTILLLLPQHIGRDLLGSTWPHTRHVLFAMVLYLIGIGFTVGPSVAIDSLNRPALTTGVSLVISPLTVALALIGLHIDGDRGAAFGFAIAAAVGVVPTWCLAIYASKLGRRPSVGDPVVVRPV